MLGENICRIRKKHKLTQEQFAESMEVTRKTIQNWESDKSVPDANQLKMISKKYGVSLDEVICDNNKRAIEEHFEKILPTKDMDVWESYEKDLIVEYEESVAEGKDIKDYRELFFEAAKIPQSAYKKQIGDALFGIVMSAKQADDYKYAEPSDYEGICRLRDGYTIENRKIDKEELREKVRGAWLGRICGCLLGKPVEGIGSEDLTMLLKESDNYPMSRYIYSTDITDEVAEKSNYRLSKNNCWGDITDGAPADDDTNYTVMASILIEKYGRDFKSEDVLELWSALQPKYAYCTAERVAFMNYANGYLPPYSGMYKNPYREYIGAQIRGDYFGYINPGNPEAAAKMAYNDACISHTKNGIYGEMFVAAAVSAGFVCDDIEKVIRVGLSQIPSTSRFYEDVTDIVEFYQSGKTFDDCRNLMRKKYPADSPLSWCYTNSNAMIVVMSLLYGNSDYGKSICMAVQSVYDTDCNGATVGSIIGAMKGYRHIPEQWTKPVNGKLHTAIFKMELVSVDELVEKTIKAIG